MSDMLFYAGQGQTQEESIESALSNAAGILLDNPSLLVELIQLNHTAQHWEAHIRAMAVKAGDSSGQKRKSKKRDLPELNFEPRNPEHFRSGQPFEWRPIGMRHDQESLSKFDRASHGGSIPDIPMQDIEKYQGLGLSEEEIQDRVKWEYQMHINNLNDAPKLEKG